METRGGLRSRGLHLTRLLNLHVRLDDGNRGDQAHGGQDPGNDLDGLDLVAERHAARHLALELVEAGGDALVRALDVLPHLVDEAAGDEPEDGGDGQKDLSLLERYLTASLWEQAGPLTVCSVLSVLVRL